MTQGDTTECKQGDNDTMRHNRMQRGRHWHKTQQNADGGQRHKETQQNTERETMTQDNRMQTGGQWHMETQQNADRGTMSQGNTTEYTEGQWHKETQQNTEKDNDTRRHNKIQRRMMTQGDTTECKQRDNDTQKRLTWPQPWSALAEVPKSVWHHPVESSGTAAPPCWPEHSPTRNTNTQLVHSTNVWSVHKPHKLVSSVSYPCVINVWSVHKPHELMSSVCNPCVINVWSVHKPHKLTSSACNPCVTSK